VITTDSNLSGVSLLSEQAQQRNYNCNSFDSVIVSGFPQIFLLFEGKHFEILWRGTRDDFGVSGFH
jgi:hypothetical protein